jgi:hypothetical protein
MEKNISDPEPDPLVRGADPDPQNCYGVGEMFFYCCFTCFGVQRQILVGLMERFLMVIRRTGMTGAG